MERTKLELGLIKLVVDLYLSDVIKEVEKKKRELRDDNHFGNCSVCGEYDEVLNVNRNHHFVCHKHKKRWNVGSNLFSGWRDETEEIWKKNCKTLEHYEEISGDEWLNNIFSPVTEAVSSEESLGLPF